MGHPVRLCPADTATVIQRVEQRAAEDAIITPLTGRRSTAHVQTGAMNVGLRQGYGGKSVT